MQCKALKCNAMQSIAVASHATQCKAMKVFAEISKATHRNAKQRIAVKSNAVVSVMFSQAVILDAFVDISWIRICFRKC